MCLQGHIASAFNLEDILNAITPDNIDSQIHHPDHEFARYRRDRIPESMGYLEEGDSTTIKEDEDEGSGEADDNEKDKDADKNDEITESGDSDDGSSSGEVDEEVQDKKSNIAAAAAATHNTASVIQQASQQAIKPDDFKIPVANEGSATKATVATNETSSTNNTDSAIEGSNSTTPEAVTPSVAPEVANTTSANETGNDATLETKTANVTGNATGNMNENTAYSPQIIDSAAPFSSKVQIVPQNKAESVTQAGMNLPSVDKSDAGTTENIQILNSKLAPSNATIVPQDANSRLVMFSEQEKEKNYTVKQPYNSAYQFPAAKYVGKADDQVQTNTKNFAANETATARQQTTLPNTTAAKRTGIQKKADELMTAEEIVEDMDSEKEEEEEKHFASASGSGSGSGNIEQTHEAKEIAVSPENTVKPATKEKTASLSANEAAFLSSMEADEDSSGSHLEVTTESGSGSGENVESAVVAEINHLKETSKEKEDQPKKNKPSGLQPEAKKQQSKTDSLAVAVKNQAQTNVPESTAKVQKVPSVTKQATKTTGSSYAQSTPPQSQTGAASQPHKNVQQQAAYAQQQPAYNQQAAPIQPKPVQSKGTAAAQYQASATNAQQYNHNRINMQQANDAPEGEKIQNAIETKKDKAEKDKMRAASSNAAAAVQAQTPAKGTAGQAQANPVVPQAQPQRLVQATAPLQAGKPVQVNTANQSAQQKPAITAKQGQNNKVLTAVKPTVQNTKAKTPLSPNQKSAQVKAPVTTKTMSKNMTGDAYGEAADLLKTSSKIELKESDDNLPGATGDDITEEDLQKLQSISVNDATGINENDFGDLMNSIGSKSGNKDAKKSKQPIAAEKKTPKAKSWTMVFNGTENEGNLPGGYGDDYLEDGSGDEESGSANGHGKSDIEMQIESSIGSSFESTMKSKRGKGRSASGSGSGSGDEYASELLPGDYGSESPLNIDEEGSGDDDESGEGLDFMSGNHESGSGKEMDKHIHALLQAHVESPNEQKSYQPERINIAKANASRFQGPSAPQPINYPSVQREYVSMAPDTPKLEQETTKPEQKSQQLEDYDEEVSGSGSGETGESSGHSNEGSGSETSFALPFAQPTTPKARPYLTGQKIGQLAGLGGQESSAVQQAVAHVAQNILNNIRQYHGNITVPATPADSRTIKLENEDKEHKQAEVPDDEESGSGSLSSGATQPKSEDAASGNKKYDSDDDDDDDEVETTPEEAETKELKSGKQEGAGQRGQIEKGKESNPHKHEELQPQDEEDEEDPKPKYNGFTVSHVALYYTIW